METETLDTARLPDPVVEYGGWIAGLFLAVLFAAIINHDIWSPVLATGVTVIGLYKLSPTLLKMAVMFPPTVALYSLIYGEAGPIEAVTAVLVFNYNFLLALLVSVVVAVIVIGAGALLIGGVVGASWLFTNVNESRTTRNRA